MTVGVISTMPPPRTLAASVGWSRGVHLPHLGLWLDPQLVKPVAVVTHAHTDHSRRHHEAILTAATYELLPARRRPRQARVLEYGEPHPVLSGSVSLHDAGHMLGSAQVLVEHNGVRTLYTGDIALRRSGGAQTRVPAADVLVIESTFGLPRFRFPDPDSTVDAIATWCRAQQARGVTPVLLAHAAGKTQSLMTELGRYGFDFVLDRRAIEYTEAYEACGVVLPAYRELRWPPPPGAVVVAPPVGKAWASELDRFTSALVSGWSLDPDFAARFGADVCFPLSNHADYQDLVRIVEMSRASRVYTVHGHTVEFARLLRRRGFDAIPLARPEQLAFWD